MPSPRDGWEETDVFIPPFRLEERDPSWGSVCAEREQPTEPGGSTDSRDGVREASGEEDTAVTGNDSVIPSGQACGGYSFWRMCVCVLSQPPSQHTNVNVGQSHQY